jgi:hypothetical protein
MSTAPDRLPTEAWELAALAVRLRRGGTPSAAVLAALDQARASLRHEPHPQVAHQLWICRAVAVVGRDEERIDAALRRAPRSSVAVSEARSHSRPRDPRGVLRESSARSARPELNADLSR